MNKVVSYFIFLSILVVSLDLIAQTNGDGACMTEVVTTNSGPVCGMEVSTSTNKTAKAFLGIPFGNSTEGENRFSPPVPADPWVQTLVADTFAATCPEPVSVGIPQSEDCLFLNIWTPERADENTDIPVMIFIYGGAFIQGNAEHPLYEGAYLAANEDVIVVNFNYRVGPFGFLVAEDVKGNAGFMDQQLAMKWVKDNIKNFGGDPEKITIFGESAGAMSVGLHLVSAPGSKDLFRAGIMESNPYALTFKTVEEAQHIGLVFKEMVDCKDLACLRAKPFAELMSAELFLETAKTTIFPGLQFYLTWTPVVDGDVITKDPFLAIEDGDLDKPIILGTNHGEGELFEGLVRVSLGGDTSDAFSFDGYIQYAASVFGEDLSKVTAKHPANFTGDNESAIANILTDYAFSCANHSVALKSATETTLPIYIYRFNHVASFNFLCEEECKDDVCHMDELPFVFHTADLLERCKFNRLLTGYKFTEEEELLSTAMGKYWTNFAKDMDPNGSGDNKAEFTWEPFTADNQNYIVFDSFPPTAETDPFADLCLFWDQIGYHLGTPWGVTE